MKPVSHFSFKFAEIPPSKSLNTTTTDDFRDPTASNKIRSEICVIDYSKNIFRFCALLAARIAAELALKDDCAL